MTPEQVAHLTQIAREVLSNVVQHVRVDLQYGDDCVHLAIADDGQGIGKMDLDAVRCSGQGITNMQERARQMGGEFDLESQEGQGLRLSVILPCPRDGSTTMPNGGRAHEHQNPAG